MLIGGRDAGKTKTLDQLFNQEYKKIPSITIGEKKVCTCGGNTSVQEVIEFCNFNRVIEEIKSRIKKCIEKYGEDIAIILPFTVEIGGRKRSTKGKINRDCIIEPLKWLKSNYKVHVVYLRGGERKTDTPSIDMLMEEVSYNLKVESREAYPEQAKEISDFIERL